MTSVLAVILGSLEMIRKRVPGDERTTRMIDNALEGARRGASLTQRMLSFARRQSLNPKAVDLHDLVGGMRDMLEKSLGPRKSLATEVPLGLPLVHADQHQLEMALLNLVVNARDAMEEGTIRIFLESSRDVPSSLKNGRYACLSVIDTGKGMDESTLARAQEPFFTTKGVGQGTGLGLAMVSGFVEQSGGFLDISSRTGEGTRVDIWLPLADEASLPSELERKSSTKIGHTLKDEVVLVVDDEPFILLSMEAALQEAGARVYSAATALDALEILNRYQDISCVVTDYAMPGMTGAQLAAAIRVKKPRMPIIIASGYAEVPEEISQYPRLQKPFSANALLAVVVEATTPLKAEVIDFPLPNRTT